jgi:replicative DNA helicase
MAPSSGYKQLDKFIKGFIPGHVYTLSGTTNAGKSSVCLNFAYRVSKQDKKVLYFALEPENTVIDYLASIHHGKLFADLKEEDLMLENENIDVFGKDNISKIEDLVKSIYALPKYDLIIIDHIGYFTSDGANTFHKQSDVMKQLAGLAKDRLCAIVIIQHLNKAKKDKGSPENNITGSAAFKQDATDVLLLVRDTEEDEFGNDIMLNTGAILIRKAKTDNPQGVVKVKYVEGSAVILESEEKWTPMPF